MTEKEMEDYLAEAIDLRNADDDFDLERNIRILTFEDAGIMTYNKGLVLRTPGGDEFQVTIVKSL
jgi:hypothetical protein